jgi:hypothetical protein
MTAGVYLRSLRRAAHVPVTHMAIRFGQGIMVVWEIESDRRASAVDLDALALLQGRQWASRRASHRAKRYT